MSASLTRRTFLGGAAAAATACAAGAALAPRYAFAAGATSGDTIVFVMLRGGLDGLSAVIPVGDAGYHDRRPRTAVGDGEVIPLDSRFGLHPGLGPLADLYRQGDLAIVHAIGTPNPSRSHFVQQDVLERAGGIQDGWLARHLAVRGGGGALRGAALSPRQPIVLAGARRVVSGAELYGTDLWQGDARATQVRPILARLHAGTAQDEIARGALGMSDILRDADLGSPAPTGLGYRADDQWHHQLHQVARLVQRQVGLEAALVDLYGWDSHTGNGTAKSGSLRTTFERLSTGLVGFYREIADHRRRVTIVVMSEFGRRVAENGALGTDHGRAGVAFVIGEGVRGGRVYGQWPGLTDDDLDDGDLRVTTDFRDVLSEVLARRHGAADLGGVFPGYTPRSLGICG